MRFLSKPADFTLNEMSRLLRGFSYQELKAGKTAGSRIVFINRESGHIIRMHKPHPARVLKKYQLDLLEEALRAKGIIE